MQAPQELCLPEPAGAVGPAMQVHVGPDGPDDRLHERGAVRALAGGVPAVVLDGLEVLLRAVPTQEVALALHGSLDGAAGEVPEAGLAATTRDGAGAEGRGRGSKGERQRLATVPASCSPSAKPMATRDKPQEEGGKGGETETETETETQGERKGREGRKEGQGERARERAHRTSALKKAISNVNFIPKGMVSPILNLILNHVLNCMCTSSPALIFPTALPVICIFDCFSNTIFSE